jgi:hypothetical protein
MPRKTVLLFLLLAIATTASARRRGVSPDSCSVTISPQTIAFPATGGRATVSVGVAGGCSWIPTPSDNWIAASPVGNVVSVDVQPNAAQTPRSGMVHIRGAVIIVTQAAAAITNLVTNSGFDSGIVNWTDIYSVGTGSARWVAPGMAEIVSTQFRSGFQLHQCVNVEPNRLYEAGTKVLIPAGQSLGNAVFALFPLKVPNCTNTAYDAPLIVNRNAPAGEWFEINETFRTFSATRSLLVVIGAGGSDAPPFQALFDDVYLRPK